jgi:hypothetical protein
MPFSRKAPTRGAGIPCRAPAAGACRRLPASACKVRVLSNASEPSQRTRPAPLALVCEAAVASEDRRDNGDAKPQQSFRILVRQNSEYFTEAGKSLKPEQAYRERRPQG